MITPVSRRAFLLSVPGAFLLARAASAGLFTAPLPDDLDLSLNRLSRRGLYRVEATPRETPIAF